MADNDLLIRINADAKNAEKAFDDIRSKTEDLEGQLNKVAKVSALGFAALAAEVGLSLHAFAEAEAASRELTQALQTQGIVSEQVAITTANGKTEIVSITEAYKSYAEQVQELTGLDDDTITKAQAVAQSFLGQTKITKELTLAIADLAVGQKIGLTEAAALIGRTVGTTTNAFARQGLKISELASTNERMAKVLDFVNGRFNGQAEAANQGLGSITALKTAFGNLQEEIGARFAPVIVAIVKGLTTFFNVVRQNPEIINLTASLIAAGLAITALGSGIPLVIQAFTFLRAAMIAASASILGTKAAIMGLVGATGIGLVIIAITEIALHWGDETSRIYAITKGFISAMSGAFEGLGKVISGAMSLDPTRINEGLTQIKTAFSQGFAEATKDLPGSTKKAVDKQNEILAEAATKRDAAQKAEQARRAELRQAENDLVILQLQNASEDAIKIKQAEIANLKALSESQNAEEIALREERRAQLLEQEDIQKEEDLQRAIDFGAQKQEIENELETIGLESKQVFRDQDVAMLQNSLDTQSVAERKVALEIANNRIKDRNLELADTVRYGAAIAAISSTLRSNEVQGAKAVSGELVALAQSKNAQLKAIGKAAAVASITIATAESAVLVYKQVLQIIPAPFGIPIATALAAARVAYGAEQIGNVTAAADGALVEGGTPGRDSVPFLLEPGELVTPKRNFEEVVGAVQTQRSQSDLLPTLQSIDQKLTQPHQTIIQGDVLSDSTFIDVLITKINERLEFGNAKLLVT